jgi:hypothetical protein
MWRSKAMNERQMSLFRMLQLQLRATGGVGWVVGRVKRRLERMFVGSKFCRLPRKSSCLHFNVICSSHRGHRMLPLSQRALAAGFTPIPSQPASCPFCYGTGRLMCGLRCAALARALVASVTLGPIFFRDARTCFVHLSDSRLPASINRGRDGPDLVDGFSPGRRVLVTKFWAGCHPHRSQPTAPVGRSHLASK